MFGWGKEIVKVRGEKKHWKDQSKKNKGYENGKPVG